MVCIGRPGCLALLLAALASAGCGRSLPPHGRTLLLQSYEASRQADHPQVVALTSRFLREFGRGPREDEALYLRGVAYSRMVEPERARADFQEALRRSDHAELKAKAALGLAELALEEGDLAQAEEFYRSSLSLEDRRSPADRAYFQLAMILQRQGRWDEADIQYSRLSAFFEGQLARLARQRMSGRAWTVQADCFEDRSRAAALSGWLKAAGLENAVVPVLADGKLAFAVQAGRYRTYEQARSELAAVKRHAEGADVVTTR